jgi:ribosomal-protein-alanine N-acetyltransferase
VLTTINLKLIPCDADILQAAIAGNEMLANLLGVEVPDHWTEFGPMAFQYSLDMLKVEPIPHSWRTYFPIHIEDNVLVGSGGYKGQPSVDGIVEIGYEIAPQYRDRGLATEYAQALIDNAFKNTEIKMVIAHTLSHENPSTSVLTKCGFTWTEEILDPDDGLIWRWELKKSQDLTKFRS